MLLIFSNNMVVRFTHRLAILLSLFYLTTASREMFANRKIAFCGMKLSRVLSQFCLSYNSPAGKTIYANIKYFL